MTIQHLDQAEILERKANVVRSRLMRTIDALDRRRHRAVVATEHIEHAAAPVALTVVALVTVGSSVAYVAHRAAVRRHRNAWRNVLARMLAPSRPPRPSFFAEAARRTALALLMIAVQEVGKRVVRHALEPAKKIDVRGERSLA